MKYRGSVSLWPLLKPKIRTTHLRHFGLRPSLSFLILVSSFPKRQLDTHRRPFPRIAIPFHLRADFPGSFADADAAEVAGLAVGLGMRVEAAAVVGDVEGEE